MKKIAFSLFILTMALPARQTTAGAAVEPGAAPLPNKLCTAGEEQALRALYPAYRDADPDYRHAGPQAVDRWMDWKWGLRIHWGLYSMVNGQESWIITQHLKDREWQKKYYTMYQDFNPTGFDADEWMRIMERAGMKYFSFTSKHHEGFCLWPTKTTQRGLKRNPDGSYTEVVNHFSMMETPYRHDIIGELLKAGRRHGLGVSLYFSHIDWHDWDFGWDRNSFWFDPQFTKQSDPKRWAAFIQKERDQITELLTWYGPIDTLCLDMGWPEAAARDAEDVARLARRLQPNVMLRNRGIGAYGDYETPEGQIPEDPTLVKRPWQVIYPCGTGFSYKADDRYKSKRWVLESLIDIVAKGGNFQVGFGPRPDGTWPTEMVQRLEYVGDWLRVNGECIYATRPWHRWHEGKDVRFTRSKDGKYVYAISLVWPGDRFQTRLVKAKPGSAVRMLGVDRDLVWRQSAADGLVIDIPAALAAQKPCEQAYAFRIEVAPGKAGADKEWAPVQADIRPENLVPNGDFVQGEPGKPPRGWTVSTPNPALAPKYQTVFGDDGRKLLLVEGNGRPECFGILQHDVDLPAGKTYLFRVRFKFAGFEDVNRHLVHAVFVKNNDAVFHYHKQGDWVVGESRFAGGGKGQVRLYFRFAPQGKVWYASVSLRECEPIKPRPVKIAVTSGGGDRKHWEQVLDAAGRKHCDVALLPETFEPGIHAMDGPAVQLLAAKAKQWKMYTSGTLRIRRGDLVYNSAVLFDRQGKLAGVYDKVMLFDPELDEGVTPGESLPVFQTDFGKLAIMTCYDSWHPEVARLLGYKGAEVILFPSAAYYMQLMHARAADNGVVIAASSGSPCGVWDGGGNQADGLSQDPTRCAPTAILACEKDEAHKMQIVTVDLSKHPSPHSWGGPARSAPGGRRARVTSPWYLEDEIARQVRRWCDEP